MAKSEMYYKGAEQGYEQAVNCCFSKPALEVPYFETAEDEKDFWCGYEDGYGSVD